MVDKRSIVICPNYIKNKLLNDNPFLDTKFMNINEFINNMVFKYKESTLFYIVNKYHLLPSNAKEIMNNLYYIDLAFNDKTEYLLNIKNDLIKNNYIIFNNNFNHFIKDKKAHVYYEQTKYLTKILANLDYEFIKEKNSIKKYEIYKFNTMEDEVVYLATSITKLINYGVSINDIKVRYDSEYSNTINKVFNIFNIPYDLKDKQSLFSLDEVKMFLNNLDKSITINLIEPFLINLSDSIHNKLISIFNKYIDINPTISDFYDTLIYELKNAYVEEDLYSNCVEFIDIFNCDLENKYLFLIGFNQNSIPTIYKDEDYLIDSEKVKLGIDTSYDNNQLEQERVLNLLNKTNNIFISYKLETPFSKYNISSIVDKLDYEIKEFNYSFINSNYNKLLLSIGLDDLLKYNIKNDTLINLYSNEEVEYKTYSNLFSGVKLKNINLNLSTTNMEMFFKCQFSFYLNYILKLDTFEETTYIKIGNLFHKVLEEVYKNNVCNYEEIIDKYISEYFIEDTLKQKFYNHKYKESLLKLIEIINSFDSDFKNTYFEEWFSVNKDLKIVGKIDKVMTYEDDNKTYVSVIDYKTGQLHYDFNKVIYGLDMQLLMYLYLIKNSFKIKNPIFTGMYLLPILLDPLKYDKNKTYNDLLKDAIKLNGYSNTNLNILGHFDKNLDSSFIKGIKLKKDNTFYAYSKVLEDDQIDKLLNIIDDNINKVISSVKNNDFIINPKRLGKDNISCKYCQYKDICYMNNSNIVQLKEYKNLEFLGGEANGQLDE